MNINNYLPEQMGSFSKPSLQLHIKLPNVFKQFALVTSPSPQFPLFTKHSSTSNRFFVIYSSKSTLLISTIILFLKHTK